MNIVRYIILYISVYVLTSLILSFGFGLSANNDTEFFQLILFSAISAFIITVIYWIFQQKEHPRGLIVLFFTEMWERFSYYGMRGLLMLYLTKSYLEGGLGFSDSHAGLIYGVYTGLVYLTPIIGGYIADRYIGQRMAITIGGILMMLGQFSLATGQNISMFYLGLLLLIIGNGFFKPNISVIVGQLYDVNDSRKDSAFTIFYMGINLGAFFAPLVCGMLAENTFAVPVTLADGSIAKHYAFHYGFFAAGIGMMLGQIMYNILSPKYIGEIGKYPVKKSVQNSENAGASTLTKIEKDRVNVIIIMSIFIIFFWAGFEQAGSTLTLYTDSFINRTVSGFELPTSWFQSLNPLFIVILAPIFSLLWVYMSRTGKEPSIPVKMSIGIILLGLGFLCMVGAVNERGGENADMTVKASIWWMIGTYFVHTCGELCLSPIGLSMVTKLSPVRLASMLMGVWFLSSFIANFLSGFMVRYVEQLGAMIIFASISGFTILLGILLLLVSPRLSAMMHIKE